MISREDVESKVWAAGLKDPKAVREIMAAVDAYVVVAARKFSDANWRAAGPVGYLKPGEFDLVMEVTRCRICEQVKRTDTQFHADKRSKSGHRDICKKCAGPTRPAPMGGAPGLKLKCASCGKSKLADEGFHRRSDTSTGYGRRCKDCIALTRAAKKN